MIPAFITLFLGGMVLGGAWSLHRSGRPWWAVLLVAALGLAALGISFWRIQAG